jgi:hypothetical protein
MGSLHRSFSRSGNLRQCPSQGGGISGKKRRIRVGQQFPLTGYGEWEQQPDDRKKRQPEGPEHKTSVPLVLSHACPNCRGEDKEAIFLLELISAIGYVYLRRSLHASTSRCFKCH